VTNSFTPSNIAVIGLGYVGCVTAACLSSLGHIVTGVDRDDHKVSSVLAGVAPFFEPGLPEMVKSNVAAGRLSATASLSNAVKNADIALICVGTPSEKSGNLGLDQLRRVVAEIAQNLPGRAKPLILAVRSTVFPGTCEEIVIPALEPRVSARRRGRQRLHGTVAGGRRRNGSAHCRSRGRRLPAIRF